MEEGYSHISVLLDESIEALAIKPDGIYVDCTFGGGGHSRAIMNKLGAKGKLIAFDHDKDTSHNVIDDAWCILVNDNFRYLKGLLRLNCYFKVDGILSDFGIISFQLDSADRGVSFRFEA